MWGIIPAAGIGSRIQPLAFSKELLPVGSRQDGETERPRAVSEYLIERMILGGADLCYTVQPRPAGLCDAIFRALPVIDPAEPVLIGLPDTIWFPEDALCALPDDVLSFLLFPVERPELFDAVVTDGQGRVREIQVKRREAESNWAWGAFKMPGSTLAALETLWRERERATNTSGRW